MKRSEIFFSALLLPLDALALFGAFALSYYIRGNGALLAPDELGDLAGKFGYTGSDIVISFQQYAHYLWVIIPAMLLIFAGAGLYAIRSNAGWWRRAYLVLIGVSMGEFFILLLFLLKKTFFLPRSVVLYSWLLAVIFVLLGRAVVRAAQRALYARNIGIIRLAVIGKNQAAERLIERMTASAYSPYTLARHFDVADVAKIVPQIDRGTVDELVVVAPHYNNDDLVILRNHCLEHRISFSFMPPLLTELASSAFDVRSVGRLPVIEVRPTPLEGWGRVLKRSFDVVVSVILIALFSPVYLVIILAMAATDPGPLIYKHRRIGKDRQPIDVWKFRSMRWEYCTGPKGHPNGDANFVRLLADNPALAKEWKETMKLQDDPRVSRIGRILRKTSLDELPQFINVLTGALSLVGPRPIVDDEVSRYGEKARILFTVKPGVTGLWQVSGRSDVSYDERIALDSRYIERWSLPGDILIMARTFFVLLAGVVGKKGAY